MRRDSRVPPMYAIRLTKELEPFRLFFLEDPFAPEDIDFIGIRSVDADEKQAIRQLGLQVFDMRHIDEHGMRNTMTEVLQDVDEDTHIHVSFDLDCLDPMEAPGVGTGVRGGPTYREMQLCMEMVADTGRLASLEALQHAALGQEKGAAQEWLKQQGLDRVVVQLPG